MMDQTIRDLIDLTNPADNFVLNMDQAEAARRVASGDPQAVADPAQHAQPQKHGRHTQLFMVQALCPRRPACGQ